MLSYFLIIEIVAETLILDQLGRGNILDDCYLINMSYLHGED